MISASSFLLAAMGKRLKSKKFSTLTKIDLATLLPKPQAISQHVARDGKAITKVVNPVFDSPEEPDIFDADPSNFQDEYLEDEVTEDEAARGYYASQVRQFAFSSACRDLSSSGQSTTVIQGGTANVP